MALFDDSTALRTERPTARRRRQAREQGHVARSVELIVAARVAALWFVLAWWMLHFASAAKAWIIEAIQNAGSQPDSLPQSEELTANVMSQFFTSVSVPLVMVVALVLSVHFLQVGWYWRWQNALPQAGRLSPLSGFRRAFSISALGRFLMLLAKLLLVLMAAGFAFQSSSLADLWPADPSLNTQLSSLSSVALRIASDIVVALSLFGLGDYAYRRWQWEASLRMTREELREELKDVETHPQIRHQRELAARRLAQTARPPVTEDSPNQGQRTLTG
jgi:flagellar biosynthetic protein FlhB